MYRERSSAGSVFAIGLILVLLVAGAVYSVRIRQDNALLYAPKTTASAPKDTTTASSSAPLQNEDPHQDLNADIDAELRAIDQGSATR